MDKRYLYAAGSFLMMLLLGVAYAWSIFIGPLEATYGWTRTQTSLAFTILMMGFSCGNLLTGMLAKRIGYKKVMLLAAVLIGAGLCATAFTSSIGVLYVTYGVCAGTGIGMIYNAVISVIPLWFPGKTGMITGLMLMGYAISTSILSLVCQRLLTSQGPKATFLLLCVVDTVVFLVGSLMMREPDEKELAALQGTGKKAASLEDGYTTAEMLRTPRFYIYFLGADFLVMTALGYLNHAAPAMQGELGLSAVSAAYVVSAMSVCNGLARPIAGQFIDRVGVKLSIRIVSLIYIVASVLTALAMYLGNVALMIPAVCLLLFGYGCQGASLPCVIRALYGNKNFSMNYSIVSLVSLTGAICPSIVGMLQAGSGSYLSGFGLMMIFCICSFPLMFLAGRE